MIDKGNFEIAYVVDDVFDDKQDSFLVLLSRYNGE